MAGIPLSGCFPVVSTLQEYMDALVIGGKCQQDDDPSDFKRFLSSTLVGHSPITRQCFLEEPSNSVRDTAIKAIQRLLKMEVATVKKQTTSEWFLETEQRNILAAGYKCTTVCSKNSVRGVIGLSNNNINSTMVELNNRRWDILLGRVGDVALGRLFIETSIFVPLKRGSFQQICGAPLINANRPPLESVSVPIIERLFDQGLKSSGKRRLADTGNHGGSEAASPKRSCVCSKRPDQQRQRQRQDPESGVSMRFLEPPKLCNATVFRRSMQYCVPPITKGNFKKKEHPVWVLPETFPLNSCTSADELLRNIFSGTPEFVVHLPEKLVVLGRRMLKLHKKCNYRFHLFRQCPAPWQVCDTSDSSQSTKQDGPLTGSDGNSDSDSDDQLKGGLEADDLPFSIGLSLPTPEHTPHGSPAPSSQIHAATSQPGSTSGQSSLAGANTNVLEKATSHEQVCMYLQLCISRVIPRELIGGKKNLRELFKLVRSLIRTGNYEKLSLHDSIQHFMASEVSSWLNGWDRQLAFDIYAGLVRWILSDYVIGLVRCFFYVTEGSTTYNALHFYRNDVWTNITRKPWQSLAGGMYQRKSFDELATAHGSKSTGDEPAAGIQYSHMRLVPKVDSFRPIVNMKKTMSISRRRTDGLVVGKHVFEYTASKAAPINQVLKDAHAVLRRVRNANPNITGAAVLKNDEIFERLKAFKSLPQVQSVLGTGELFMAKFDIQSAFDTVNQSKLITLLRDCPVLDNRAYMVYRHWAVSLTSDSIKKYARHALPLPEAESFGAAVHNLSKQSRQQVYGDWSGSRPVHMEGIVSQVVDHIHNNVVRTPLGLLHQYVGIPQGSVMSSLLCNFFYGQLEREHLSLIVDPSRTLLVRMVDDFFVVSTSRDQIMSVLERMSLGVAEYGCRLNGPKTLVNFNAVIGRQVLNRTTSSNFPWCGKLINDSTLDVMIDYAPLALMDSVEQSVSINTSNVDGCMLRHRMLGVVRSRIGKLFLDGSLNSGPTVSLNLYQHLVICAKKFHVFHRRIPTRSSQMQLFGVIKETTELAYIMMRSVCSNSGISATDMTWLAMHAFKTVLLRKRSRYTQLLQSINYILALPKFDQSSLRFNDTVKSPLNKVVLSIKY